jgi:Fe-S-cluster-containing hydrogenase component 2
MMEKELCVKCGDCAACCPKQCITMREDRVIGDYDSMLCLQQSEERTARRCYPCGICTKVCPIGQDRRIYKEPGFRKKYLNEAEALKNDPGDPAYSSWQHIRAYGVSSEPPKRKS